MGFDFHFTLISAAAIQGFILSIFVFSQNRKKANSILAWLIFLFSINLVVPQLTQKFYFESPHLLYSSDPLLFLFGPLIYIFTLFITGKSNSLTLKDLFHALPFLLFILFLIPFYLKSGEEKLTFIDQMVIKGIPQMHVIGWGLACLHIVVYMLISLKVIQIYRVTIKESFSDLAKINLSWLYVTIFGNAFIWALDAMILMTYLFGIPFEKTTFLSHLLGYFSAFFIYVIGYKTIKNPEVFGQMTMINEAKKYQRSGLSKEKSLEYKNQILLLMEEENPYLSPDISLNELSQSLSIPNNHLSQVINEMFNQNFFDFINSYRVEEAKEWLIDPKRNNATMLAIAFESGFKSKSTFNAAFKKHSGYTPSQFKNSNTSLKRA